LDLPTVPGGFGAEPRVQQQVVPLSWKPEPASPAPAPAPPPEDAPDEDQTLAAVAAVRMKFAGAAYVD